MLESLLQVVDAVPRMEVFVGNVCNTVFCNGEKFIPRVGDFKEVARTPDSVPGILQSWIHDLEILEMLQSFKYQP